MPRSSFHLLVVALLSLAPPPAFALDARYTPESIDLSDLTPGGEALYFHASRQSEGYIPSVGVHRGVWVDEDGDGTITQPLGAPAPRRAVVVLVDLATGALATAPREETLVTPVEVPTDAFLAGPEGEISAFRHHRERVEMVVVRPGVGAWKLSAADGTALDVDPTQPSAEPVVDGTVHFSLSDMEPVGDSALAEPPEALAPGDVVVMIDPRSFELYTVTFQG